MLLVSIVLTSAGVALVYAGVKGATWRAPWKPFVDAFAGPAPAGPGQADLGPLSPVPPGVQTALRPLPVGANVHLVGCRLVPGGLECTGDDNQNYSFLQNPDGSWRQTFP